VFYGVGRIESEGARPVRDVFSLKASGGESVSAPSPLPPLLKCQRAPSNRHRIARAGTRGVPVTDTESRPIRIGGALCLTRFNRLLRFRRAKTRAARTVDDEEKKRRSAAGPAARAGGRNGSTGKKRTTNGDKRPRRGGKKGNLIKRHEMTIFHRARFARQKRRRKRETAIFSKKQFAG
jgi:hypothetical protein